MHGDFRRNLIRFNLLLMAEDKNLKLENLEEQFKDKAISYIDEEEIISQVRHLIMERYLTQTSGNNKDEYAITREGEQEIEEVKKALEKLQF